ncbi:MAG TPA: endonuclease/exonuclease/phosphatase family protein, partial [Segetibacter sp.]
LLFAGYKNLRATFGLNYTAHKKAISKNPNSLRIMTWNVRGFDNPSSFWDSPESVRRQMFDYIDQSQADVLCFQEFTEHFANGVLSNTTELVDIGYRYYYKTNELIYPFSTGVSISGTAIFSKVPLVDSGKTLLGDPSHPEHLAYVDLLFSQKKLRIFSTHLKSLNLFVDTAYTPQVMTFHSDSNFVRKSSKFEKLKVFEQDHAREVVIAKAELNKSPYPVVFTADMNSVPAAYPYHIITNGLQDAFVKKGFGLGGTMVDSLPKTLRIDLLLVDKRFDIKNYHLQNINLSDHFPQMVDLQWKQ